MTINSVEDLLDALNFGSAIRQTDATAINARSSRSHAVFSLNLVQKKGQAATPVKEKRRSVPLETLSGSEQWITVDSKLHFVDLAGSERLKNTGALGERAKEGISINAGLASLGKVISQLSSRQAGTHISYRDSRLTRLLQDSLGGNAITYMVACVNPAEFHLSETLNTVTYAQRARAIQSKPQIQQIHDDSDKQAVIERLRAEINFLRDQIRLSERADRRSMAPQERSERIQEREIEMQNQLLDIQENYNALSHRHAKLISEIARARDSEADTPILKEAIGSTNLDRLKRSTSFAESVESIVLEYEKTIETLEASLSNSRASMSTYESTLLEKETRLVYLDTINSQLQSRLQKAMDREANDENYLRDLETRVAGATTEEERVNSMTVSLKKELARVRESEAGAEDYISTLEERLAEAEQQHEMMSREIERLEHVVERQRSINKLDNLLYELDHIRQTDPPTKEQSKVNGHTRNQESDSFHSLPASDNQDRDLDGMNFSPAKSFKTIPESEDGHEDGHEDQETAGGAVQHLGDEGDDSKTLVPIDVRRSRKVEGADEPTSPAQTKFVNDKLEAVTSELFDLRVEHESTINEFDELHRKYQVALTSLAELQDALEDARRDEISRPTSMVIDKSVERSRTLSAELSSVGDRPQSTAPTDIEDRSTDIEPQSAITAATSHREDELVEEVEKLRDINSQVEGEINELKDHFNNLQNQHQETLEYVEELKTEVSKTKGLTVNGRASPNPGILRRKDRSSVLSDRALRSFASIRTMVLESFEDDPDKAQTLENHISVAMTEFGSRSDRVIQLEGELTALRKEMDSKTAIITGLTRERSSLKTSPIDMSALVTLETQLRESENQVRSLASLHTARERELSEQIEHLKTSLEHVKSAGSSLTDSDRSSRELSQDSTDGLVSQLQKEVADWRSKHESAVESMKASETQLLATITDLETNLKTVEQQASRSISPEAAQDFEVEKQKHQDLVLTLQRELEQYKSTAESNARHLAELEASHSRILEQVEKDTKSKNLVAQELDSHKSLVANLENQIVAHQASLTSHQEALQTLKQSHTRELDEIKADADKSHTETKDRLTTAITEHQQKTTSLQAELEQARSGTDTSNEALQAEVTKAKEQMSNLVADAAMILNKPTNIGNLTSHLQALVNARKDISAMHDTATSELRIVREELEAVQSGNSESDRRLDELNKQNEELINEIEAIKLKEQKSSRLVEELEQQLETNFDQTQAANHRLSTMQTERHEALQTALNDLDEARQRVTQLEAELAERTSDLQRSNSGQSEHANMRKSISPVNLPSPPPAIPLPPLPAAQANAGNPPPTPKATSPPASRHASKDINTAQLVEDQEARIRTIEKHLFAEKQLTATLEEALTDLESSSTKQKSDMEAWRRKAVALEEEVQGLRKDKQNTRLSVQQMEDEARKRIDLERAKLEERMKQLNNMSKGKNKKKSSINCF